MSEETHNLSAPDTALIPAADEVNQRIYNVRGQNVMLDSDLAKLYGVETFIVNRAVTRNSERFPEDFMFRLTSEESEALRFQIGISNAGRGGRRYLPYVFTQEGIAMLSSVLRSERAVQVNVAIMRAFVQMRRLSITHRELAWKITQLEQKYDTQFEVVFDAIERLIAEPPSPERRMGFRTGDEE